eukprot:9339349-Alexandrium_andersonii.AAC.1
MKRCAVGDNKRCARHRSAKKNPDHMESARERKEDPPHRGPTKRRERMAAPAAQKSSARRRQLPRRKPSLAPSMQTYA